MAEFVYALHDFTPEHDDEIPFTAGDRIQVVEKDDLYGDGWWQGRNLAGKVGLFPQAYTSPSPPVPEIRTPTTLQPLQEENAEDAAVPAPPPPHDAVMAATLTDVQEAIEQLAVRRDQDTDAARSFSFASTRDPETETEDEAADEGEGEGEGEGPGWHKDARKALAERAEKENEKRKLEEEAEASGYPTPRRQSQTEPPIAVELSDESDEEEDDDGALRGRQHDVHPHHHRFSASASATMAPDASSPSDPSPSEPLQPAITLHKSRSDHRVSQSSIPTPTSPSSPQEAAAAERTAIVPPRPQTPTTATAARFQPAIAPPIQFADVTASLPSPATSSAGGAGQAVNVPLPKSPFIANTAVPVPIVIPQPKAQPEPVTPPQSSEPEAAPESIRDSLKRTHPSEWSVEQVVEWLKTKNVDEATCDKFIEHEITGDVLMELDATVLKEELNITAFGKRVRIVNAIVELRRPASFSSDPAVFNPGDGPGSGFANGNRQDTSSLPDDATTRSLVGLGLAVPTPNSQGIVLEQKNRPAQLVLSSPSDGALHTQGRGGSQELILKVEGEEETLDDRGVQSENENVVGQSTGHGIGAMLTKRRRFLGRSTESGSSRGEKDSSSRKSNEVSSLLSSAPNTPNNSQLDKASLSVEESVNTNTNTNTNTTGSGGVVGSRPQHMRGKRSVDGAKGTERLSFFSATLGKSRKPPPRYSILENDASSAEPHPDRLRSIAKMYLGGGGGKKGGGPSPPTEGKEEHEQGKEKEGRNGDAPREPSTLRKRHVSTTAAISPVVLVNRPSGTAPGTKVALQPGQSVLDQIGRPDYAGWLRKKGERYNTWKLRYLVLKGPHLYYLRSNSRAETKIKGYIKVHGYKVVADENANPGKYGFRIVHDTEQSHFFSSEEQMIVREWMKALMKATIDRDFSKPVVSSCNIPTIPLAVAQAMNPAPRPPSPTARAATQRALRRENPNQLSSRDARVLMGLPAPENGVVPPHADRARLEAFFVHEPMKSAKAEEPPLGLGLGGAAAAAAAPPRPTRGTRHSSTRGSTDRVDSVVETELVNWANSVLPEQYRIHNVRTDLSSGLVLMRLAESITGKPNEPPVLDGAFTDANNLEGMFRLFDFLLEHDIKMGSVSINDVKHGRPDKTIQLLKTLRAWSEKRNAALQSPGKSAEQLGSWLAMEGGNE